MFDQPVKTTIRKLGNSQGVLIPKPILAQVGLKEGAAEMTVEGAPLSCAGQSRRPGRGGHKPARFLFRVVVMHSLWPEFGTTDDEDFVW